VLPARLNQTIGDKLSDQLPMFLWPKLRFVFYVLAAVEIGLLLLSLLAPRNGQQLIMAAVSLA
jgi:hypothetical protein